MAVRIPLSRAQSYMLANSLPFVAHLRNQAPFTDYSGTGSPSALQRRMSLHPDPHKLESDLESVHGLPHGDTRRYIELRRKENRSGSRRFGFQSFAHRFKGGATHREHRGPVLS